jgi:diketogulonate reductase-like aldo/keto reductase
MIYKEIKALYDGRVVPAIWQGGSVSDYSLTQAKLWREGVRFGCTAIDTAENYGDGESEKCVGELIKLVGRDKVFVASKVAPENATADKIHQAFKHSLKRLGTDYIDLYQIHWYNPTVPLEETLKVMMELQLDGKIKYIGVSNFTFNQVQEADLITNGGLATVQMEYSLQNRVAERDIIPWCHENGVLFLAYTPLKKLDLHNKVLNEVAHKYKRTPSQIALNWLVTNPPVCVLPKTTSLTHLVENAQSTEFWLELGDYELLDHAFRKEIIYAKPSEISCVGARSGIGGDAGNGVSAYVSIEEAKENRHGLFPSPLELAKELEQTMTLSKPIIVRRKKEGGYQLVNGGGGVRYWAWVLAFGMNEPIECVIEGEQK